MKSYNSWGIVDDVYKEDLISVTFHKADHVLLVVHKQRATLSTVYLSLRDVDAIVVMTG